MGSAYPRDRANIPWLCPGFLKFNYRLQHVQTVLKIFEVVNPWS